MSMKNNKKDLEKIKNKITPLLRENKVKKAGIFGSYARGEQKKGSDIDILVDIDDKNFTLLDLVKLKILLGKILKKNVDLVEYSTLHPMIKKEALREEVRIL